MKGVNLFALFSAIVFFTGWTSNSVASIADKFNRELEPLDEFSSERIDYGQYELVMGKLVYQYPDSPEEVEGFVAGSSRIFEGRIDRTVYDLASSIGTLKALSVIENLVDEQDYRIAFSCERESCGSIKGWGVYYPEQADGSESDQYYVSAIYPKSGPPERVMSAHISMVGGRVRVTIDEISLLVDIERAIQSYASSIMNYWSENGFDQGLSISGYGLGSSDLTTIMMLKSRAIAKIVDRNPEISLRIIGYTDQIGDESVNHDLSVMRAKTMADFLATLGVPERSVDFEGLGIFKYSNGVEVGKVAPQHRKVLVVASPPTALTALN